MLEYMLTYKNGFNGSNAYFKTQEDAVFHAMEARKIGLIPDKLFKYNRKIDKFELIGRFNIAPKEV